MYSPRPGPASFKNPVMHITSGAELAPWPERRKWMTVEWALPRAKLLPAKLWRQKLPAKIYPPIYWQQPVEKNKTHLRNNAQALLEIMLSTLLVCYSFSKIRHMQNINKIILYQIRVSERSLAQEEFYFITRDQQINISIAKFP